LSVVAVDLLSTNVTCAVLGKSGKVLLQENSSLENLEGYAVSLLIQNQIKKLLDSFENKPLQPRSVGISIPGIYYSKTGTAWAPNIPGWTNYPIKKDMSVFSEQNIVVKIGSKRTCDILGEKWLGAAQKSRNAIFLSIGSGIGAGILIDGKIVHGFNDGAGAAGWMAIELPHKDEYKAKGCFEYHASAKGILNSVKEQLLKGNSNSPYLKKKDINQIRIEDVHTAYKLNDQIAIKVFDEAIIYWGMAAANIINLFNPELIIFGGSLFGPAVQFLERIKEESNKWCQPVFAESVKFLGSKLGANAGLFGAGHLALKKF
jgi:glucokinase